MRSLKTQIQGVLADHGFTSGLYDIFQLCQQDPWRLFFTCFTSGNVQIYAPLWPYNIIFYYNTIQTAIQIPDKMFKYK